MNSFLNKLNKKLKVVICVILVSLITLDFVIAGDNPNTGEGVSGEIQNSKLKK